MPEAKFEKPTELKKADKIVSESGNVVVEVKHMQYNVDGKAYPKLHIRTWNQDKEGFPLERPKSLNLPIELQEQLAKAILSLKDK